MSVLGNCLWPCVAPADPVSTRGALGLLLVTTGMGTRCPEEGLSPLVSLFNLDMSLR